MCMDIDTAITGFNFQIGSKTPQIIIGRCNYGDLPAGQTCMNDEELQEYYSPGSKSIQFMFSKSFIDYEDIEMPVKSILIGGQEIFLESDTFVSQQINVQQHQFNDLPMRFQIGAETSSKEFLSIDSEQIVSSGRGDRPILFRSHIMMNEKLNIHNRQVLSIMEFLEKLGGTQASLFLVGAILNFLFTGREKAL